MGLTPLLDEMGQYLFLLMFYNWGEPLLNKALPRFIEKAHALNIETEVHTNLSLPLSDAMIEDLLTAGLDNLNASIDGFSQETYQVHRVGGNIELVKKNLERFASTRDRLDLDTQIAYKMLVFSHNEHEVPAAKRYCDDLGITFIHGDAFIHNSDWLPSHRKDEKPYYTESEMQDGYARAAAAGAADYFEDHERHPYWFPYRRQDDHKYPEFCSWHYGVSVVTAGGPVAPCCATAKDRDDFGRASPEPGSFAQVWNNERYRHARAVLAGEDTTETQGVDTVCDRCHFPKFVQQLYSSHDLKVTAQFHRLFAGIEPALDSGFRLLSRIRYGQLASALLRRGVSHPLLEVYAGRGDEREMTAFVKFYKEYLLCEPTALDPIAPDIKVVADGTTGS